MVLDYQLFLGFPLSPAYEAALSQVPSSVRNTFIQPQASAYLQSVEFEGISYLGKFLGAGIEGAALDASQVHLCSLLKCLVADYSYDPSSLQLLALPSSETLS